MKCQPLCARSYGIITAAELYLLGDTGAYGAHALTVNMVGGFRG
jgi:hypothetical protein